MPFCKVTLYPVAGQLYGKPCPDMVISPPKEEIMLGATFDKTILTVKSIDFEPPYGSHLTERKY